MDAKEDAKEDSKMSAPVMSPLDKAKAINEDLSKYGSFAEIGAGQEVARWFFRAGKASATVAKTMSAYDMVFSDAIYGAEENHRYVCESRLLSMLEKEYAHIENRIWDLRGARSNFFVFADTVASKSSRSNQSGHGWLGVRFQTEPLGPHNDVVIHVRMLDGTALEQQEVLGVAGVNLIYGCFWHYRDPVRLMETLRDCLRRDQIEIDMIRFDGPAFKSVDNCLMSLHLVRLGLTDAALISPEGENLQPSEALYKKHLLIQRGRFRPVTNLHLDMLEAGKRQFLKDPAVKESDLVCLMEITLNNLLSDGKLDIHDFLARVNVLQALGHHVLISNYGEYYRFSEFLRKYSNAKVGLIMGVGHLNKIFDKSFYSNVHGGLLASLGLLFREDIKALIYPAHSLSTTMPSPEEKPAGLVPMITARSYEPAPELKHLYRYMYENHAIEDIESPRLEMLSINSEKVLADIQKGVPGWEKFVPSVASKMIQERKLFRQS